MFLRAICQGLTLFPGRHWGNATVQSTCKLILLSFNIKHSNGKRPRAYEEKVETRFVHLLTSARRGLAPTTFAPCLTQMNSYMNSNYCPPKFEQHIRFPWLPSQACVFAWPTRVWPLQLGSLGASHIPALPGFPIYQSPWAK